MDASTLEILRKHPDIDIAAQAFVRLLVKCKGEQLHGKAGVLADLRPGKPITQVQRHRIEDQLIKT